MVNVDLLWYLLIPVLFTAFTIFILHKWVDGMTWPQSVGAACIGLIITSAITSAIFYIGRGARTMDEEVYNGQVLSKSRVEGTYEEAYSCNCHEECETDSKGHESCETVCQTCYREHYTVTWSCQSNIGQFHIAGDDSTDDDVYNDPDPPRYSIIKQGDPVSRVEPYTNYIKAVPDTLFRPVDPSLLKLFVKKIPPYPISIYDIYRINRVLPVGVTIPNIGYWNEKLSDALKTLGPQKQANAVIVITNQGPDYFYALQSAWLNGKKNDIILVIGTPHFPQQATWVKIMALDRDAIFQVKLRDDILALPTLTADGVINALSTDTMQYFHRKRMHDFGYLKAEIDPPAWLMWICMLLVAGAYGGFWLYVYNNRDAGSYGRFGHPRFYR
jgi:hypothetical protein